MGILLGFDGSVIRDILLNAPINPLAQSPYLPTAVITAIIGALFGHYLLRPKFLFAFLDAVVIGMFTVIGAEKAWIFGMPTGSVIFIGTLTAIGGGLLGDILTGETPDIMRRGPWMASVAVVGAIWFVFWFGRDFDRFAELSTIVLVVFLRIMSLWRGWNVPTPEDLKLQSWVKRIKQPDDN